MATRPIVLLDEDQQRTLQQTARSYSNATSTQLPPPRSSFDASSSILSYPTTPPSEPRTNFTTAGTGVKNPFATNEPRTNFTSAAMSARQQHQRLHEHVAATGGRTGGDAPPTYNHNARLNSTFNSSPKTNFTSQRYAPADVDPSYGDFMPVMLSDRLSDTDEIDEKDTLGGGIGSVGYVGNSSRHKLSVKYILIGVALGITLGVVCSSLKVSELAAKWIALPGELFLRALKALVIPYVFCSVAVAIGDIVFVGKVSVVGLQTFKVFLIMWITTVVVGLGVALLFRSTFRLDRTFVAAPTNALGFTCASNDLMLELQRDNSLACTQNATLGGHAAGPSAFEVVDVNNALQKNVKRALALMTVSDQILAILYLIVPRNIVETLANGDLLSTITFAMVLGAIAGRNYFTKTRHVNYLYLTLLQLRNTFFLAMEWVIWLTPVAVISTIGGSFATNQDAMRQLQDVYVYVLAVLCAALVQLLVTQPAIVFLLTRCNPYKHMAHMTQAYVFAFSVSSSLATAPVTLACVKKARVCSQSLANFVLSIGVCSNMSGASFYFPVAIVWLAESSGNGDALTPWRLLAIALLSVLGCAGTPPIPNAGVVLMATVYKTVFGVSDLPATFPLYVAVDFLVDRITTVCNVNDDIMALKVIAENTDETIVGDHLGERE